ncbi:hypothetical protein [Mesorhizobium sp.]|uniref:hypothetical protein n=1 Tax=Mesorhizobium sp. TaxID=1871066 RepID=UPI000FE94ED1|nr:hypothetical protein [Mesorhizobium sp.]RWI22036.1 MAG: hypothetical protein EOQ92_18745 [Mesorhizobium sp.]RWK46083.1 MAG: hypothetical protein EOR47_27645 [Mesorhizobium sp.]RWK92322.1 MAG: hypothetical protein EOR53_26775 [Mesorhizobium sp.]TIP57774.1 MAG: hypothetical protein E5X56_18445 [Mesorhizobium sp.]TIQ01145.1 MAG: hypothetical protein E5X60_01570 [Mesorhizobium sp.]
MAKLSGSSADMELQARSMTDGELVEISSLNDFAPALKAKAELQRRSGEYNAKILWWARCAVIVAIVAIIAGLFGWSELKRIVGLSTNPSQLGAFKLTVTTVVTGREPSKFDMDFSSIADCEAAKLILLQQAAKFAAKARIIEKENNVIIDIPQVAAMCGK